MPRMKRYSLLLIFMSGWMFSACSSGMPQLFWEVEDNKPDYARGHSAGAQANGRAPLDVPPELRKEIEVPMPDKVATEAAAHSSGVTQERKEAVAGSAVSLHARRYDYTPAQVFSATIDAMTALNMPVDSVDSPSGTVTTEWVGKDVNSSNVYVVSSLMNMFGAGAPTKVRYRYVVRVLRAGNQSQLEVRTLGQQYANQHWSNVPLKQKVSNELFAAVEEQLARLKKPVSDQANPDQFNPDQSVSGQTSPVPVSGDQIR
jgi:hypothetical protein